MNSSMLPSRSAAARALRPRRPHFERQAHLAREDDELARDVHARQVVARIGLGVALLLGLAHDRGERLVPSNTLNR
jgi:hypothetical protein